MRFSGPGGGNASQWGRREAETALYAARGGGMAVALAYGVLFSTAITLLLVPSSYLILEDMKHAFQWLAGVDRPASEPITEPGPAGVLASPAQYSNEAAESPLTSAQPATAQSMQSRTQLVGAAQSAGKSSKAGD